MYGKEDGSLIAVNDIEMLRMPELLGAWKKRMGMKI
jgi:hypothetical protein